MKTLYDFLRNKLKGHSISLGIFILIEIIFLNIIFGQITFSNYIVAGYSGKSMCPTLGEFSISIINLKDKDFQVGDIVVYNDTNEDILIQHRIIDKYHNFYQFQGDYNPIPDDGWFPKKKIIGKLVYNLDLKKCEVEK